MSSPRSTTTASTAAANGYPPPDRAPERVGDLVEPAAVGPLGSRRQLDLADEPAVPGRVAGAVDAEHAVPDGDGRRLGLGQVGQVLGLLDRRGLDGVDCRVLRGRRARRADLLVGVGLRRVRLAAATRAAPAAAHRNSPFISDVGTAASAAVSFTRCSVARCAPSFVRWIWSWSLRIASINISGRGGQPGR